MYLRKFILGVYQKDYLRKSTSEGVSQKVASEEVPHKEYLRRCISERVPQKVYLRKSISDGKKATENQPIQ